jgi:hypothetical protein
MKPINDTPTSRDENSVKMSGGNRTAGRVDCDARPGDKIFIKKQALAKEHVRLSGIAYPQINV